MCRLESIESAYVRKYIGTEKKRVVTNLSIKNKQEKIVKFVHVKGRTEILFIYYKEIR